MSVELRSMTLLKNVSVSYTSSKGWHFNPSRTVAPADRRASPIRRGVIVS